MIKADSKYEILDEKATIIEGRILNLLFSS